MVWKIERWLADVYRHEDNLFQRYGSLSARELAVVACATLDVALAELLALRFIDDPREASEFLGADEDGNAPAGSFGARIQLAYLLGVIPKEAAGPLRAIKALRNVMAHRVNVDILGEKAQRVLEPLRAALLSPRDDPKTTEYLENLVRLSRTDEMMARTLVILIFSVLHDLLHDVVPHVDRVSEVQVE